MQRGMAVAQLRGESSAKEPLVREVVSLAEKALPPADQERMKTLLTANTNNIQFILSNREEYEKVTFRNLPHLSALGWEPVRPDRGLHAESPEDRRGEEPAEEALHRRPGSVGGRRVCLHGRTWTPGHRSVEALLDPTVVSKPTFSN